FPRIVIKPHTAIFCAREIFWGNDAEVEQIDGQPISDKRAKLFHYIERQRAPTETRLVEKSEVRITSDSGQCTDRFVVEQCIAETEERVDRISRRTTRALFERYATAKHPSESVEMDRCSLPFDAAQTFARTDRLRSLFQTGQLCNFTVEITF